MVTIISKNVLKEEFVSEFLRIIKVLVEETRKEPGCVYYDLVHDRNQEGVFIFLEKYVDQAALETHNTSEHFKKYVPMMRALRESSELITGDVVEFK